MTPFERAVVEPTACARHRNVQTALRCGRCGTPICPKCLVHTDVGARCPTCARAPRNPAFQVPLMGYLAGGAAGLAVGAISGALLGVLQFGAFSLLPLLLTGYLVGEAVSAAANRRRSGGLAIVAFTCALVGPLAGTATLLALSLPGDASVRASAAFALAIRSQGGIGLLLLIVAGLIASTRVQRR